MYVLAFRDHVGARVCFAYLPSTRAARCSSSYVCVGLCIRTYVARYLVIEVHFSGLETRNVGGGVGVGGKREKEFPRLQTSR